MTWTTSLRVGASLFVSACSRSCKRNARSETEIWALFTLGVKKGGLKPIHIGAPAGIGAWKMAIIPPESSKVGRLFIKWAIAIRQCTPTPMTAQSIQHVEAFESCHRGHLKFRDQRFSKLPQVRVTGFARSEVQPYPCQVECLRSCPSVTHRPRDTVPQCGHPAVNRRRDQESIGPSPTYTSTAGQASYEDESGQGEPNRRPSFL